MYQLIYNTDKAIADYLWMVLVEAFGETFLRWDTALVEANEKAIEYIHEIGRKAAMNALNREPTAQEDLLPGSIFYPPVNEAYQVLEMKASRAQMTLLELYSVTIQEQRDIEHMALAVQIAEETGNEIYAARVKEIMGLDEIDTFTWWG